MPESDCLILCKSVHHENTAHVVHAMAEILGADTVVAAPAEVPYTSLGGGLVGFGSGVYYGRMHPALFD